MNIYPRSLFPRLANWFGLITALAMVGISYKVGLPESPLPIAAVAVIASLLFVYNFLVLLGCYPDRLFFFGLISGISLVTAAALLGMLVTGFIPRESLLGIPAIIALAVVAFWACTRYRLIAART